MKQKYMEDSFTLITRFQYSSEALIYKGKLESEGIEVFMRDINTIDSNPLYSNAIGGVKLFVRNEDVEKANAILSQISDYSYDDNNLLIKCPNCSSEVVTMETSIRSWKTLVNVIVLGFLALLFEKHNYKCQNCKFEFD